MHKDSKWAKNIIALQEDDGKWGCFHSLSKSYGSPITTEQALRRLERLGYTIEDACIQKAVSYMNDCLIGKRVIPDRQERLHDWDVFTAMMLSTWIRRFTLDNANANEVAKKWATIITKAFSEGVYDHDKYIASFQNVWGVTPQGGRLIDFVNFYPISMLNDCLNETTEIALVDYILNKEDGIYYVYDKKLTLLPYCFESRETSYYLNAIDLLAHYKFARDKFQFVAEWLMDNRNEKGLWDLGKTANDGIYFPLSNDWRKRETRESDCTERIYTVLKELTT